MEQIWFPKLEIMTPEVSFHLMYNRLAFDGAFLTNIIQILF